MCVHCHDPLFLSPDRGDGGPPGASTAFSWLPGRVRGQVDPGFPDAGHQVRDTVSLALSYPTSYLSFPSCSWISLLGSFLLCLISLSKAQDFFSEKYQTGLPFTHLEVMLGKLLCWSWWWWLFQLLMCFLVVSLYCFVMALPVLLWPFFEPICRARGLSSVCYAARQSGPPYFWGLDAGKWVRASLFLLLFVSPFQLSPFPCSWCTLSLSLSLAVFTSSFSWHLLVVGTSKKMKFECHLSLR